MEFSQKELLALQAVLYGCTLNKELFQRNATFFSGHLQPGVAAGEITFSDAAEIVNDIIGKIIETNTI